MRRFFVFFCMLAALCGGAASAHADGRAFPPDNCTASSPFMGFTGTNGSNTFCNSGQDIFKNAIPNCTAGQTVAYDGTRFYCKGEAPVPSCTPGTFLTYDGTTYTCQSTGVATCGDNQVLTFNGTNYYCVNRDATIPVCGANQFLTYNGSYRCATVVQPTIPNCAANEVVKGNGSQLYCAPAPAPVFGAGTVYNNSDYNNNILHTPVPYNLCVMNMSGQGTCGRCAVSRNADSTWNLDQASCSPGTPNASFIWCGMTCY